MRRFAFGCSFRGAMLLWLLVVVGCSRSARYLPLDQERARAACAEALDAWKAGKRPADLKPKLIVGDEDWDAGKTLVTYEVLPDETNDGTNLHIPVRLTLKDAQGKERQPKVTYTVGTAPVVTVFRE
jgi:hypothetical protein